MDAEPQPSFLPSPAFKDAAPQTHQYPRKGGSFPCTPSGVALVLKQSSQLAPATQQWPDWAPLHLYQSLPAAPGSQLRSLQGFVTTDSCLCRYHQHFPTLSQVDMGANRMLMQRTSSVMDFKGTISPYKVGSDNHASERSVQLFCPAACSGWQAPVLHSFDLLLTSGKFGSRGFFFPHPS